MTFAVGSLVRARGREWVVLPESTDELLILRPLGGSDEEVAGVLTTLESVEPARFALPDPHQVGDYLSARLLRDALRLGFRSSAGPFRSFGHLAVDPRPYQIVPLLMALRLDPVRLMISDDVGIGKTIEAGLVAREMLDQGDASRLCILCPPHLAEQWQDELGSKFHIEAELVLPSTAARLERDCKIGETLFNIHPYVVVSLDYIKSDKRRAEFLRTCPELVIVDEAHTCAWDGAGGGPRHQRHELVAKLAEDRKRHLILVTATPHSGKEEAFKSLLRLLDPAFAGLPTDLTGATNEPNRRHVARHFIQRRRADIKTYLDADTPFPEREENEATYTLTRQYKALFERVLAYVRETVRDSSGQQHHQRVRWWSALALLRSLASSPAAAAATLRSRAPSADAETVEEVDALGRRSVLDLIGEDSEEAMDVAPGSNYGNESQDGRLRSRLLAMANDADELQGELDAKLSKAVGLIKKLLDDGFNPIVFCRFIPTADYVADQLRQRLGTGIAVASVTGTLPAAAREARVKELGTAPRRVLVATDCLSEGINLQDHFDAVFHYDLSWNPTRHEQREGRVDRFGQLTKKVRVLTYYGTDNQIDGIVLQVLLRKHKAIRNSLGISVPIPGDANAVVEAILEGLLLRRDPSAGLEQLVLWEGELHPKEKQLLREWETAADRERRSRTMFSQQPIKIEEVSRELAATRRTIGSDLDVREFVKTAMSAVGGWTGGNRTLRIELRDAPGVIRGSIDRDSFEACFDPPGSDGEVLLGRTHPFVEGLASYIIDSALDPLGRVVARRCGAIRTRAVRVRTTLLLTRYRFHLLVQAGGGERELLAEDWGALAFRGAPEQAEWLTTDEAEALLAASPDANVGGDQATEFVRIVVDRFDSVRPRLDAEARARAADLLEAHRRVRREADMKGARAEVQAQLPADVLGAYVLLPVLGPSA